MVYYHQTHMILSSVTKVNKKGNDRDATNLLFSSSGFRFKMSGSSCENIASKRYM